jgi:hypothetical protein
MLVYQRVTTIIIPIIPSKIKDMWNLWEASAGLVQDMARTDTKVRQVGRLWPLGWQGWRSPPKKRGSSKYQHQNLVRSLCFVCVCVYFFF